MNVVKLSVLFVLSLSVACDVETRDCESMNDCFAGESCLENSCLSAAEIQARKNDVLTTNNQIQNNGSTNNGIIVISCDENGTINVGEDCETGVGLTKTCESLGMTAARLSVPIVNLIPRVAFPKHQLAEMERLTAWRPATVATLMGKPVRPKWASDRPVRYPVRGVVL